MGDLAKIIIILGIVLVIAGLVMLVMHKAPFLGKTSRRYRDQKREFHLLLPAGHEHHHQHHRQPYPLSHREVQVSRYAGDHCPTKPPPATESDTVKRAALLIAVLASFLTPFMVSSINIALPAIGRDFSMSAVAMSWVPTSYLLSTAMFLVPFGRLADIHGRKKMFPWGIGIFTLASLLLAFSPSAAVLILFGAVQGFGSAMIFGTGMAIVNVGVPGIGAGPGARHQCRGGLSRPFARPLSRRVPDAAVRLAEHLPGERAHRAAGAFTSLATRLKGEWAEARGRTIRSRRVPHLRRDARLRSCTVFRSCPRWPAGARACGDHRLGACLSAGKERQTARS